MQLTEYITKLWRRWRIIAATVLVAVGLASCLSLLATPTYESVARVFVSSSSSAGDLGSQMAASAYAQQKVLSYASVASSRAMAKRVVQSLGLDEDPATVASHVSTSVEYGTVLITITVKDVTAQRAADIAGAIIDNYNELLDDIDSAARGGAPIGVSVMEPPSVPSSPVSPRVGFNIAASLVVGLLLGVAFAALRDLVDDTVKSGSDSDQIDGVPVIGTVAKRTSRGRGRRSGLTPLVTGTERSMAGESLRRLRTNLRFAEIDSAPRSILVTSTRPGEGKSFISGNLAALYAASGEKVVLVDLDLRRPVQAERLRLDPAVGVTSVLLGMVSLEDAVQHVPGSGFDLLAAGMLPPNPTEVIGTAAMRKLLQDLGEKYSVVIVDSTPVGAFDDARLVARAVDGTVLVARHKYTRRHQVSASLKSLRDIDARVLGVVVNLAPDRKGDQYYYEYYDEAGATVQARS